MKKWNFTPCSALILLLLPGITYAYSCDMERAQPVMIDENSNIRTSLAITNINKNGANYTINGTFSATNNGRRPLLALDHWGIRVETD